MKISIDISGELELIQNLKKLTDQERENLIKSLLRVHFTNALNGEAEAHVMMSNLQDIRKGNV